MDLNSILKETYFTRTTKFEGKFNLNFIRIVGKLQQNNISRNLNEVFNNNFFSNIIYLYI
jgi:hypothetical protein